MERTRLRQILLEIFEDTRGDKFGHLDEQAYLREGLGLDSVDLVCMVMSVEDRIGVYLTEPEIAPLIRVADLLDLLEARLAGLSARAA
jgi:acyl carrier protein